MTHMLHRLGSEESLAEDYTVLTMRARGHNDGSLWRMKKVLEIAAHYPIVNFGDVIHGSKFAADLDCILSSGEQNTPLIHMVFTSREDLSAFMKDLKEEDLGISVVVSGLFAEIFSCCRENGITPHTANNSLGVFGRTEKLPSQEVLEVTSMCGHSMVPAAMVKKLAADVRKGKTTPEKAAERLGKNCICGIFNVKRAARLLKLIAPEE